MDLLTHLKNAEKPIVLYGMGNGADKIIDLLESNGIKVSGVFASDGFVRSKLFRGMPLMTYGAAKAEFGDMIVLMSFGTALPEVFENVYRISAEQELYVPDVPVVGEGVFDISYARAHQNELSTVYNALTTEKDKKIFASLIEYKISGVIDGLLANKGTEDDLYALLAPSGNEVYMDCGAFNGDTVAAYLRHSVGYSRIIAVEPDVRSFKKLSANTADLDNVLCINAPLGKGGEYASFSAMGSRGSKLDSNGTAVRLASVDEILGEEGADYIKIDVEGAESAVLEGAAKTIIKFKPKLLVSCYHRLEDVYALPLQVLSMRPDYKMHLWHPAYLPPWDAAFIFI